MKRTNRNITVKDDTFQKFLQQYFLSNRNFAFYALKHKVKILETISFISTINTDFFLSHCYLCLCVFCFKNFALCSVGYFLDNSKYVLIIFSKKFMLSNLKLYVDADKKFLLIYENISTDLLIFQIVFLEMRLN